MRNSISMIIGPADILTKDGPNITCGKISKKQYDKLVSKETFRNINKKLLNLVINYTQQQKYTQSVTYIHKLLVLFTYCVLAFGTHVRGFKPGRSRRIFQGEKILSTPSFGREVKLFVPCRIFAACKRTRKCTRASRSFRSKLPAISRPSSSSFHY